MRKPDILLIMTDQQKWDCLGLEDHPVVFAPNMDGMGGADARLRRACRPWPFMCGEDVRWCEYFHIEPAENPRGHDLGHRALPASREQCVWFTQGGREQSFDLTNDPHEMHNLTTDYALS